jgi:hypothetical protein
MFTGVFFRGAFFRGTIFRGATVTGATVTSAEIGIVVFSEIVNAILLVLNNSFLMDSIFF